MHMRDGGEEVSESPMSFVANTPDFPQAECASMANPDLFFPETKEELDLVLPMLRKTCSLCVHQLDCLRYAVDEQIEFGIWGGKTPAERKAMINKPKRRYVSNTGARVDQMRQQGLTFVEIARILDTTPGAAQAAHKRWKLRGGVA